jgi:hypothetical protein
MGRRLWRPAARAHEHARMHGPSLTHTPLPSLTHPFPLLSLPPSLPLSLPVSPSLSPPPAGHRRPDAATMRDLILAVRADEANHRDVNHTLADLSPNDSNPFLGKR